MAKSILNFDDYMEDALVQGITFEKVLTWTDDLGDPVDLTGYTGSMKIRRNYGAEILYELTNVNGRIVFGGVLGTITLNIPKATMDTLAFGRYIYDIVITDPYNKSFVLFEGTLRIKRKVS